MTKDNTNWQKYGAIAAVAGLVLFIKPDILDGAGGGLSFGGRNGKSSGTVGGGITPDSYIETPATEPTSTETKKDTVTGQSFDWVAPTPKYTTVTPTGTYQTDFILSDKILAAMQGQATTKKEATVGGFGTPSNPNTNPAYVYAVQQSKTPIISSYAFGGANYHEPVTQLGKDLQAFNVAYKKQAIADLKASAPKSGGSGSFSFNTGNLAPAPAPATKKSASIGAASSTNTGGWGLKQVGTTSSGGRIFK